MLEQGTQAPSPAPDLIPAKTKNQENSHWDWYSKRGHFRFTYKNMNKRGSISVVLIFGQGPLLNLGYLRVRG